jgi:Ni/Co efflux regulator RcnB
VTAAEQSSLLLVLPCVRRLAAVMKRPAGMAGEKPANEWEDEEQEEQTDEEQHQADEEQEEETKKADDQELAEAAEESSTKKRKKEQSPEEPPSPFCFPDGSMIKLGVYTHKSYILYKKQRARSSGPCL